MGTEKQTATVLLPISAVDSLIRSGDGDAALLYLYLCRTGRVLELQEAARAIGRTEAEIASAAKRLREIHAFPASAQAQPQAEELPEYASEEIVRRSREDPAFKSLIGEAQNRIGKMLSSTELKTLYGIYDHLGLPPEVILLLINHCAEQYREKFGEGRRPTMRAIEKEAFFWANREVMTLELAEAFIERQNTRESGMAQVRKILGLCDRALGASEKRYIEGWLEQGFSPEAIEIAYDRTVTQTGSLKWKYMHSILQSWSSRGLLRAEDILREDPASRKEQERTNKQTGAKEQTRGNARGEQAEMERLLSRLREEK